MSPQSRAWTPVALPAEYPSPAGAYSPAVRAGNLIFLSGQVSRDPRTGTTVGTGIREQTRATLENAARVLAAAGSSLDDVVSVTAYVARMDDWAAFDDAYREMFRPPYPARTTVGAELRGYLVEISLIARIR